MNGGIRYTIAKPTPQAGFFEIWPGTQLAVRKRPAWIHRVALRLVFGFRWIETTKPGSGGAQ